VGRPVGQDQRGPVKPMRPAGILAKNADIRAEIIKT